VDLEKFWAQVPEKAIRRLICATSVGLHRPNKFILHIRTRWDAVRWVLCIQSFSIGGEKGVLRVLRPSFFGHPRARFVAPFLAPVTRAMFAGAKNSLHKLNIAD
jgi:hypothetical protein